VEKYSCFALASSKERFFRLEFREMFSKTAINSQNNALGEIDTVDHLVKASCFSEKDYY